MTRPSLPIYLLKIPTDGRLILPTKVLKRINGKPNDLILIKYTTKSITLSLGKVVKK